MVGDGRGEGGGGVPGREGRCVIQFMDCNFHVSDSL